MNILLDTCVLLDYLQGREPFFDSALNIMIGIANRDYSGFISANSMTDLFYIIHRSTKSDIETLKIITRLSEIVSILDTTAEDCIRAMHSQMGDYEDAVMAETAHREQMDYIVTRNKADYSLSRTPALTPDEFLLLH